MAWQHDESHEHILARIHTGLDFGPLEHEKGGQLTRHRLGLVNGLRVVQKFPRLLTWSWR
jgi:hypothetical protein